MTIRCWWNAYRFRTALTVMLASHLVGHALAQSVSKDQQTIQDSVTTEAVVLPRSIPDPIEPINRAIWAFNRGVMLRVVKPTARLYRFIVGPPLRRGIRNFGRNITYPGRLVNNLLQAKWSGARHETDRFFCNTIAGAAGFLDVATRWKIPKSDADFAQTFSRWGWKLGCYLMLPIFGSSNEWDAFGFGADTAANPLTYLSPYSFIPEQPLTYFSPYAYYSGTIVYNNLADTVDKSARLIQVEMDPYSLLLQNAWAFTPNTRMVDFELKGPLDEASLQTLQSISFTNRDLKFPNRGQTRSVLIPAIGKELKFTFWL